MSQNKRNTVEIACPHQGKIVKASYPCGADGQYLLAADGTVDLELIRCSQDGGRCAETLCALHRFNRRGAGTWYPDRIRVVRAPKTPRAGTARPKHREKDSLDQLC